MRTNRLTLVYKFMSIDDIEARAKSREILNNVNMQNLPDGVEIEIRLHEVHQAKQPRNIPIEAENTPSQ